MDQPTDANWELLRELHGEERNRAVVMETASRVSLEILSSRTGIEA